MSQDEPQLHRCFYALRFEPPTLAYLAGVIDDLRRHGADIAWVREANLHLTLRFLGEITDAQLEGALAAPRARLVDAFSLRAEGLGAFPGLRNARTLWAGVGAEPEDRRRLMELQSMTESWARAIGLPQENRRYRAHVTLGRVRRPGERLREVVDEITTRECLSPPSTITAMVLLRSTLTRDGSMYEEVGRWGLKGKS